jgi:hypothetical protein
MLLPLAIAGLVAIALHLAVLFVLHRALRVMTAIERHLTQDTQERPGRTRV